MKKNNILSVIVVTLGVFMFSACQSSKEQIPADSDITNNDNEPKTVESVVENINMTKLFDFSGSESGAYPRGSLHYNGGFLFGMTYGGGVNNGGVVFKINPDGTGFTKLLDLGGEKNQAGYPDQQWPGGVNPQGSLISDSSYLYGVTFAGGMGTCMPYGGGVIFKVKHDGTEYSKLLDFASVRGESDGRRPASYPQGNNPIGSLFSDGTFLYGTTMGSNGQRASGIFKIKPDGTEFTKLLDFNLTETGSHPHSSLISDGTFLYGTTYGLRGTNINHGGNHMAGTIFRIKPDGSEFSTLHDFYTKNDSDGTYPTGSLTIDGEFLYGMTSTGGELNKGIIFKIKRDGTEYSKLTDFLGYPTDGENPVGSLLSEGSFMYGMTHSGGVKNAGVIFRIKFDGSGYSKLVDLDSLNGYIPLGSLISDGKFLYGMAEGGGSNNMGTIFKIEIPN